MGIRKCIYCGKPFNSAGVDLCADCAKTIDDAYAEARKYLYQNPEKTSYASILENTEISEKALNYLIDKNMLEVRRPTGGPKCSVCGAAISGGSLCADCMKKILSPKPHRPEGMSRFQEESTDGEKKQSLPMHSRRG